MPNHRPEAIANAFLQMPGAMGRITQMKLQKLVYIAHGRSLALTGRPLVCEEPRAWDYGPVFPELRDHVKSFGRLPVKTLIHENDDNPFAALGGNDRGAVYEADLTEDEKAILDTVWEKYGKLTAFTLSDLTHKKGTPWDLVYHSAGGRSAPISNSIIQDHYKELAGRSVAAH